MPKPPLTPGTWSWFECDNHIVATGYFNPHSLIAGRILSLEQTNDIPSLLTDRLREAFRKRIPLSPTESIRLVFSESDFLPGLIIDWYSGTLVLQSNTAGIDTILDLLQDLLPKLISESLNASPHGFVIRADSGIRQLEGVSPFVRVPIGDNEKLSRGEFSQDGLRYAANFLEGQKTGFFLDQRENRSFLETYLSAALKGNASGELKILDLCSYSGGWGFVALKAGARHVTFVDDSQEALELVKRGTERNQFPPEKWRVVKSDVFKFLESDKSAYDVIVADPPAFVKSKKNLPQAIKGYEKLNRLAWRRLNGEGLLLSCSCSYHLSEMEFFELLQRVVAKEEGLAHVVYRGHQAKDHPVLLSMPETQYLKCVGLKRLK